MSTFLGRLCKGMTMNEMRDVIMQPDFAKKCVSRCSEIEEIEKQVRPLRPESLSIYGPADFDYKGIEGEYIFESLIKHYGMKFAGGHVGGVSAGTWKKEGDIDGVRQLISIESVDVWGTAWEIFACPSRDDDDANNDVTAGDECENKRVLYRWENGIYNSLIPPKKGWKVIDGRDADLVATKRFRIDYTIC